MDYHGGTARYSVNGRDSSQQEMLSLLQGGGNVPDDSSLWCLTVIGLGPWLRNQNATLPDELAQALGKLHDEFQKSRALALLNDLVQGAA